MLDRAALQREPGGTHGRWLGADGRQAVLASPPSVPPMTPNPARGGESHAPAKAGVGQGTRDGDGLTGTAAGAAAGTGPAVQRLVFVDVEASSLQPSGFPVEAGWCSDDGGEGEVLICPAPGWIEPPARLRLNWSRQSQDVHGIALATLLRAGLPHTDAARAVLGVLTAPGVVAASDAPSHDGRWLRRLTAAAGLPDPPRLAHVRELQLSLFRSLASRLPPSGDPRRDPAVQRLRDLAAIVLSRAEEAEERRGGVRHRALADARAHLRVWRDVRGQVQALTGQGWEP